MSAREDHRFSIKIHTSDLAVLYCLRALADYSQKTGNTRIAWGGTTKENWEQNDNCVTFHFTKSDYRHEFEKEAHRVLPYKSWDKVNVSDNDPAKPTS